MPQILGTDNSYGNLVLRIAGQLQKVNRYTTVLALWLGIYSVPQATHKQPRKHVNVIQGHLTRGD